MTGKYAVYWDSSAVISCLCHDRHSEAARDFLKQQAYHLISSLAIAESCAVINRLRREGHLPEDQIDKTVEILVNGPWSLLNLHPDPNDLKLLAGKWKLRGADLWHLALAVRIKRDLPELQLLTYDQALKQAGQGENLLETAD